MVGSTRSTLCANLAFVEKRSTKQREHRNTLWAILSCEALTRFEIMFVNDSANCTFLKLRMSMILQIVRFQSTIICGFVR